MISSLMFVLPLLAWRQTLEMSNHGLKTVFNQLKDEGIEVKYVTTDGDGKSFEAAHKLYNTIPVSLKQSRYTNLTPVT